MRQNGYLYRALDDGWLVDAAGEKDRGVLLPAAHRDLIRFLALYMARSVAGSVRSVPAAAARMGTCAL